MSHLKIVSNNDDPYCKEYHDRMDELQKDSDVAYGYLRDAVVYGEIQDPSAIAFALAQIIGVEIGAVVKAGSTSEWREMLLEMCVKMISDIALGGGQND